MKTKTKYVCDICNSEYDTPGRANQCEAMGYPASTTNIKEGDEIDFYREQKDNEVGVISTYFHDKGIVLYKFGTYHEGDNRHVEIMVVACKDDEGIEIERQVLEIDLQSEGKKLFSPNDYKFKKGWAAALRQMR